MCVCCIYSASHVCKTNILNLHTKKKNIEYCGWFSYNGFRVSPVLLFSFEISECKSVLVIQDNLSWHIYYQLINIYLYCNRCMYWQYKDVRMNICFEYCGWFSYNGFRVSPVFLVFVFFCDVVYMRQRVTWGFTRLPDIKSKYSYVHLYIAST
jgi:hypothetical protein